MKYQKLKEATIIYRAAMEEFRFDTSNEKLKEAAGRAHYKFMKEFDLADLIDLIEFYEERGLG